MYDWTKHGDFQRYYDTTQKRNLWLLGYFGGGAVNVVETYHLAHQFAAAINVPLESICIDEILRSSRYKGFKFIYSIEENQTAEPGAIALENVYQHLID